MKKIKNIIKNNAELGELKREVMNGSADEIVEQTLAKMKELAIRDSSHPMITKIAEDIKCCCEYKMAKKAFNIIVSLIQYVPDPKDEEYVRAPIHCLKEQQGDCDDMSTLFASIMKALNISVMFKAIAWRRYEFTHVYCLFYCSKIQKWIVADPVIKVFGKEKAGIIREKLLKV